VSSLSFKISDTLPEEYTNAPGIINASTFGIDEFLSRMYLLASCVTIRLIINNKKMIINEILDMYLSNFIINLILTPPKDLSDDYPL